MKLKRILILIITIFIILIAFVIGLLVCYKGNIAHDYVKDEEIIILFRENKESFEVIRDYMLDKDVNDFGEFYLSKDDDSEILDANEKLKDCGFGYITKRYDYYPGEGFSKDSGFYIEFVFMGKIQQGNEKHIRWIVDKDINNSFEKIEDNWYLYTFIGA